MNAVTIIERPIEAVLPEDMDFETWVEEARKMFAEHRQAEWKVAEWMRVGIERFHDEPQLNLFLDQIGVDKKRAIADAKVARLIPPAWRSDRVSFDVCKQIAKIEDEQTRQRLLKRAVEEHWNEREAHHHVVEHKRDQGEIWDDDHDLARLAEVHARAWNREDKSVLKYLWPYLKHSAQNGFCAINLDVAIKDDADED